jgi:hypothetical protein
VEEQVTDKLELRELEAHLAEVDLVETMQLVAEAAELDRLDKEDIAL